jgi:hypothetical protein
MVIYGRALSLRSCYPLAVCTSLGGSVHTIIDGPIDQGETHFANYESLHLDDA